MNDPFDTVIQDIETAWEKDHPQTVKNLFKEASTTYLEAHDYEHHLRLLLACLSIPCLLYTSPSPRDATLSRMPSSA